MKQTCVGKSWIAMMIQIARRMGKLYFLSLFALAGVFSIRADSAISLPAERLMLFNQWIDGTDYGDYFGGQWDHDGGPPAQLASTPRSSYYYRRYLLNGSNHVHNAGWKVIDGKTGTSALMRSPSANYIGPLHYDDAMTVTNYQANLNNTLNARVESPFYPNGIGTIYFDAVNVNQPGEITLEIATNMFDWVTQNVYTNFVSDLDELVISNETGDIVHIYSNNWVAVCSTNLNAAENSVRGTEGFVRFRQTLNYRDPIRFRIRRSSVVTTNEIPGLATYPDAYFLAIDNIQVSTIPYDVKI